MDISSDKPSDGQESNLLAAYQTYLDERETGVRPAHRPFYRKWVAGYLSQFGAELSESPDVIIDDDRLQDHLGQLKEDGLLKDWQILQADQAVRHFWVFLRSRRSEHLPKTFDEALEKLHESLRLKHYSPRTERSYVLRVKQFFGFLKKDFKDVDSSDARRFLSWLARAKNVSASTQNQAFNAILFLFRNVLVKDLENMGGTLRARRKQRIPVVLSTGEVNVLLSHLSGTARLICELLYGCGLRLSECLQLRVKDVDMSENLIIVRGGKGNKDRVVMLPGSIKAKLHEHLSEQMAKHAADMEAGNGRVKMPTALGQKYTAAARDWLWQWVFAAKSNYVDADDGQVYRHHIHETVIQKKVRAAVIASGIPKKISAHTLRHSFATHLLQSGVNIRIIRNSWGIND